MPIKVYEYKNCSTCQKAIRFLETEKLTFEKVPIVDQPPSIAELRKMLEHLKKEGGSFKNLFNTSGLQYRELKVADRIKDGLTESEALKLLSQNGKLIKRPFLLTEDVGVVGFKPEIWKKILRT